MIESVCKLHPEADSRKRYTLRCCQDYSAPSRWIIPAEGPERPFLLYTIGRHGLAKALKTDIGMGNNCTMDACLLPDEMESLLKSGQMYRVAPFINEQMILSYTSAHYNLCAPRQVVQYHRYLNRHSVVLS